MNTRKIAAEYRLSHWAKIMQERKESGLNITEYCKTAGMHTNTYFYWQKKLREAACTEFLQLPTTRTGNTKENVPQGWAICEIAPPEQKGNAINIEIGKSRLSITSDVDMGLLTKICRVLVELC